MDKFQNKQIVHLLVNLLQGANELQQLEGELNIAVKETFLDCCSYAITGKFVDKRKKLQIESVIDYLHEEIHIGHWSCVPLYLRQYFTAANFLKCIVLLKITRRSKELLQQCLESLDLGLLLGCPLDSKKELLSDAAKVLMAEVKSMEDEKTTEIGLKRHCAIVADFDNVVAKEVDTLKCPSLELFHKAYFIKQIPLRITDCMSHWPATSKWQNINYLLNIAGERTVPVEIGSHYVDEGWSQKLMKLKEFISKYYLSESGDIGYLAQHNLFNQITELKEDIRTPEYCCLSLDYENSAEPEVNAWFGPKGTVSPLHQDPKNNILAQVFGTKHVVLCSPDESKYLYPHEEKLLDNTAQVDPLKPDLDRFPEFHKARLWKCLLGPGEMLFIPKKWWHHIVALDKSFSVSFWWQ